MAILRRGRPAPEATCPTCRRPLDEHNRHVRFRLPDPVLAVPAVEREARTWQTDVMMQVEGVGAFVRALLPVQLTGGYTLTFGLWLRVRPDDLQHAFAAWWAPSYPDLILDGFLANNVEPWGLLGKPVRAVVRDPEQTPYVDSSDDHDMTHVLADEWAHEFVLDALPERLRPRGFGP